MDELEKKELDALADEAVGAEAETGEAKAAEAEAEVAADGQQEDALKKELEEIRDMFQEALDSAAQQEQDGEFIQELEGFDDDDEEAEAGVKELPLCECCGEAPVSENYGEGYAYCDECRELMKHYPLRIGGVIAILAMILVFGLSAYFGVDSMENALVVLGAQSYASENKMMSTVQSLYSFASDTKVDSDKAVDLLIDGFLRTGYVSNARDTIGMYFTESELNLPWNKKYKKLAEFVDNFLATRDSIQTIVGDAFSGKEFDCDELIAQLDKAKEAYIDEENGILYNSAIIEYYKYELLRVSGADLEKQLEILRGIEESDKDGLAFWIYAASICEVASKLGNEELAREYFDRMVENNSEDMKAYTAMALYYRYLELPDADSIISLCEEAAANAVSGDTSYYPTLVIAYLIKGEGALALDTMTEYMNSNYYNVSNCNLYALCALYCGNTEVYDNMVKTLANSGFEVSDIVEGYKNGKLSIEEAVKDMRGEIG